MHFYRVPRLGSFMVVPLEYESCISAVSLDAAVTDSQTTKKAIEEQRKIREEWDDEQEKVKQEKERNGEPYTPEHKVWETIEEKPFATRKKQYAVCLDTLGQDRELTDVQRRFVLETIKSFKAIWEEKERRNLVKDRDRRIAQLDHEKDYLESGDAVKSSDEEEKFLEDSLSHKEQQGFPDDDSRELFNKQIRIIYTAKLFKDKDMWRNGILELKDTTVVKMRRIL